VRTSMQESLVQILSPKKRIDILRDVMEAKRRGKPYVIVFCGVNGVGKSTNLAKVVVIRITFYCNRKCDKKQNTIYLKLVTNPS